MKKIELTKEENEVIGKLFLDQVCVIAAENDQKIACAIVEKASSLERR